MLGSSNLMMGLTLVLVVCLAVVLGLVLVLLAELYCSILLRRRSSNDTQQTLATTTTMQTSTTNSPPLPNLYTQSILTAPRNLLYPSLPTDVEKQQSPENQENLEDLVYISNPVYDGEENVRKSSRVGGNTPFETPDTSPSRLETEEDDDCDEGCGEITSEKKKVTPPLTPMKKVPEKVVVDLESNNGVSVSSTSSNSGTPCTSLSW